jgi:hypothetical protein
MATPSTEVKTEAGTLMLQLAELITRVTQGQVQIRVESSDTPSVTVKPGFVKLPFEKFEKEYVEAKTLVHALRQSSSGGRSFTSEDFTKPTFFLTLACLQFLEQVIRLICACVPTGGIVGNEKIAKKVRHFVTITKGIFDPVANGFEPVTTTEVYNEKGKFQEARREFRKTGDSTKHRVSVKAYKGKKLQKKHFVTMMNFAKQLAMVCRVMICHLPEARPQWLPSTWDWKSTIPSIEYLCVQCKSSQQTSTDEDQKKRLCQAFKALNAATQRCTYIDNDELRTQSVPHATMLYTVLFETIVAMKKKWTIPETLSTIHTNLLQLNDSECDAYKEKSKTGVRYIFENLSPFWNNGSYQGMFQKLKTSKNAGNSAAKEECQKFCLALSQYAMATTPKVANRTTALVNCMDRVLLASNIPCVAAPAPAICF